VEVTYHPVFLAKARAHAAAVTSVSMTGKTTNHICEGGKNGFRIGHPEPS
jgi:hypothetical protein